jgi:amino acid permease
MILFAYMYQVNIPMIYHELERRNRTRMGKVIWRGSLAGVFLYASVGIFGYLTFDDRPKELLKQNILLADYNHNIAVIIGQFTSFFSVYAAMPLLYLPAKETVEELFFGGRRMKPKQNVYVTFILVLISYIFAIFVPSIGDAMALSGCTTNPMVRLQAYPFRSDFSSL